ncbi:MAG: hypothetical protein ABSC56_06800 [Solirubrobacteraceae bacterium]|jgi:hypothetical protein
MLAASPERHDQRGQFVFIGGMVVGDRVAAVREQPVDRASVARAALVSIQDGIDVAARDSEDLRLRDRVIAPHDETRLR